MILRSIFEEFFGGAGPAYPFFAVGAEVSAGEDAERPARVSVDGERSVVECGEKGVDDAGFLVLAERVGGSHPDVSIVIMEHGFDEGVDNGGIVKALECAGGFPSHHLGLVFESGRDEFGVVSDAVQAERLNGGGADECIGVGDGFAVDFEVGWFSAERCI